MDQDQIIHRSGQNFLEHKNFLNNRENLPPTPITTEAKDRLTSWGLTPQHIEQIRLMTSRFRYDLCEEKSAQMANHDSYLFQNSKGKDIIAIPYYFNSTDSLTGECGSITRQFQTVMNFSGLLEDINDHLTKIGKPKIICGGMDGLSPTHFNQDHKNTNHLWNTLVQEGPDDHYQKRSSYVIIDASFQTITNPEQSRYKERNIYISGTGHEQNLTETVELSTIGITNGRITSLDLDAAVLGISKDKKFIYSFGFARQGTEIVPIVRLIREQDKGPNFRPAATIDINTNTIVWNDLENVVTPETKEETVAILKNLQKIKIVHDQSKADSLSQDKRTIIF